MKTGILSIATAFHLCGVMMAIALFLQFRMKHIDVESGV
jgi:hypothetical protein